MNPTRTTPPCRGIHIKRFLFWCGILLCTLWQARAVSGLAAHGPPESGSLGQTPETAPRVHLYSMDDLIRIALESSPDIWAEQYSVKQAEARLGQAKAGRLPRAEVLNIVGPVPEARGNAVYSPDSRSDVLDNLGPFTRLEITLNQPLFTFGRLKANTEAALHGLESKREGVRRRTDELIRTIKELYFTLQLNYELLDLVSDTAAQFSKAISKAEDLLEQGAGTVTQQDLLKLRYGYLRASIEIKQIENGRTLVHDALRRFLSLPQGEDFDLAEKRLVPLEANLGPLETYRDLARTHRPEWRQLESGIKAKAAELKAEEREYFPTIFVSGMFRYAVAPNRDKQENPFVVDDFNYLEGGLVLGWRYAFDFGLPHRVREKQAEYYQLLQQREAARSGILLEVDKAYKEALEKREALALATQARKNGRALATTSAASFQLGLGEAKEVFEALRIYAESAADYYMAVKEYNVSLAELARATGTPSIP